jgi:hypothetical protein
MLAIRFKPTCDNLSFLFSQEKKVASEGKSTIIHQEIVPMIIVIAPMSVRYREIRDCAFNNEYLGPIGCPHNPFIFLNPYKRSAQ